MLEHTRYTLAICKKWRSVGKKVKDYSHVLNLSNYTVKWTKGGHNKEFCIGFLRLQMSFSHQKYVSRRWKGSLGESTLHTQLSIYYFLTLTLCSASKPSVLSFFPFKSLWFHRRLPCCAQPSGDWRLALSSGWFSQKGKPYLHEFGWIKFLSHKNCILQLRLSFQLHAKCESVFLTSRITKKMRSWLAF